MCFAVLQPILPPELHMLVDNKYDEITSYFTHSNVFSVHVPLAEARAKPAASCILRHDESFLKYILTSAFQPQRPHNELTLRQTCHNLLIVYRVLKEQLCFKSQIDF